MLSFSSAIMLMSLCCVLVLGKEPISVKESSKSTIFNRPIIFAAASAALGIGGKFLLDGPLFNDPISLAGKTAVITGGNTGLGKETASKLFNLGANTIILCRDATKAQIAIDDIILRRNLQIKEPSKNSISFQILDLTSLKQIEECSASLSRYIDRIDILVNNAGVMAIPTREFTSDGFEKHIGINHLGHYALTGHLLHLLRKSPASRVVTVSSAAHLLADKDISSDPNVIISKPNYEPWTAYGNSKLANILFTKKLAALLPQNITPLVCHPGGCRTELGRYIFDPESVSKNIPPYALPIAAIAAAPLFYFTKSAEQGAQTQIFLSASKDISSADRGYYFDNSAKSSVSALASDPDLADWLWAASERLTGVKYSAS